MPCDVATQWNSTFKMLDFALDYRGAIDAMCLDKRQLGDYELNKEEWQYMTHLRDILMVSMNHFCILVSDSLSQPCKDCTLVFSEADVPTVGYVIPFMDQLDQQLATFKGSTRLPAAIRAAASFGKDTLNRYYEATDESIIYRMAISKWHLVSSLRLLVLALTGFSLCSFTSYSEDGPLRSS
jgi:hypothetical protein